MTGIMAILDILQSLHTGLITVMHFSTSMSRNIIDIPNILYGLSGLNGLSGLASSSFSSSNTIRSIFNDGAREDCFYQLPFQKFDVVIYTFIFTTFLWHTFFIVVMLLKSCWNARSTSFMSQNNSLMLNHVAKKTRFQRFMSWIQVFTSPFTGNRAWWKSIKVTRSLFYTFLLTFSFLRLLYFFMKICISYITYMEYTIDENAQQWFEIISLLFYHTASTSFYVAFMTLAMIWAEEYLLAASLAVDYTNNVVRKPKFAILVFNCGIAITQLILFCLMFPGISNARILNFLQVIQLFYHSILCFAVVFIFFALILYSKSKRVMGLRFESNEGYMVVLSTTCIISMIIILKAFTNFVYGTMRVVALTQIDNGAVCEELDTLVVCLGALFLDLIPIAIVVFVWKSPNTIERTSDKSYLLGVPAGVPTPTRVIDKLAAQSIPIRRNEFDDDGTFIASI